MKNSIARRFIAWYPEVGSEKRRRVTKVTIIPNTRMPSRRRPGTLYVVRPRKREPMLTSASPASTG